MKRVNIVFFKWKIDIKSEEDARALGIYTSEQSEETAKVLSDSNEDEYLDETNNEPIDLYKVDED